MLGSNAPVEIENEIHVKFRTTKKAFEVAHEMHVQCGRALATNFASACTANKSRCVHAKRFNLKSN